MCLSRIHDSKKRMSSATPLVSVVMPCFNAGPMLRPALLSVLEQTYPNIEIIFVDNNSVDGSLAIAEEIAQTTSRQFHITTCAAQGANNARNWGYGLARGDFIQWMDADDWLDPDKIALQVAALQQQPTDDIAYCDWTMRRIKNGKPLFEQRHSLGQIRDQVHRVLSMIWYPPHLYLLRRGAAQQLQDVQGWWPARKVGTDVEYSAIAAMLGLHFRYVAHAHVHYNVWSASQISGSTPYRDRAATFAEIFLRLRQFAKSDQVKASLTHRHKVLLDQSWDLWRMPPELMILTKLTGRRFRLRHVRTGKEIEVRPREAAIANSLLGASHAMTSSDYAVLITQTIPEIVDDCVAVVETIQLFQREGFMELVSAD